MSESKITNIDEAKPAKQAYANTLPDKSDEADFEHLLDLMVSNTPNAIEELAGYLVTEDPTYLPEAPEAKALIRRMGRDKLLRMMLARTLENHKTSRAGGQA